jgi:hypothetical protein
MKKIIFIGFLGLFSQTNTNAQGCSDAGFCTLPYRHAKAAQGETLKRNGVTVESAYNIGEEQTTVIGLSVQYDRFVSRSITWSNKLTAANMSGSFGKAFNAGDLYSTITFVPGKGRGAAISLLAGVKIPLTRSNDKINGVSLPMVYQSSLGTYDLIAGASFLLSKWDINAAVQVPLINDNKNSFLSAYSPIPGFLNTNLFERKADVLLRLGYPLTSGSTWRFNPNLLGIYHLGKDSFENIMGKRETISGSDGFTLNVNLQVKYLMANNRSLQFSIATPLVVRDRRPDGLTRSLVVSAGYGFGW